LNRAFECDAPNYYIGISCPCCGPADYDYYRDRLNHTRLHTRTTYANIFSNGNWRYFNERIIETSSATRRQLVLVTNWNKNFTLARRLLPSNAVEVVPVCEAAYEQPIADRAGEGDYYGGAVLWYCCSRDTVQAQFRTIASSFRDAIFLVQLGPVANILIHQMFLRNRENTYLDMGHSLDGILFGDPSRAFHSGEPWAMCDDMDISWDL
jgi:hypothetical protein